MVYFALGLCRTTTTKNADNNIIYQINYYFNAFYDIDLFSILKKFIRTALTALILNFCLTLTFLLVFSKLFRGLNLSRNPDSAQRSITLQ